MSGKDDFMDEFYDGPYPEETLRSTEVACCEETARKVLSRTREIIELQGQINKVLQKSLDSKKKEIMELKEELNTVELLRIERKPQVSREFKQFLQKHDRNRLCESCPPDDVSCAPCLVFLDHLVAEIEKEGILQKMSKKLIETKKGHTEAKEIVTKTMMAELNFRPIWDLNL